MNAKHTPPPWIAIGYEVRQPGGRMIAYTGPHHTPPDEYPASCKAEDEANAIVIAALPKALELLKAALKEYQVWETLRRSTINEAEQLISNIENFSSASAEPRTAGGHNS